MQQCRESNKVVVSSARERSFPKRTTTICLICAITLFVGCQRKSENQSPERDEATETATTDIADKDAKEILRKMEEAYRTATSYSDDGRVVLRYRERGDIISDEAPLSVVANLPNQLEVKAYYARVVCDGSKLLAKIKDEQSGDFDGQVLHRELSGDLKLEDIFQNSILREAVTSGMAGQPLQLNLLYDDDPMKSVLANDANARNLDPAEFEGYRCYRIATDGAEGEFVFWIDTEMSLLRRLDFPAASLLSELAQSDRIKDLSLRVEFRNASFEPLSDNAAFDFPISADAKQVGAFVLPPQPLPTDLFGKKPEAFSLYNVSGDEISQESLLGKNVVLLWFTEHPTCRSTVEQLSKVKARRSDDENVAIYAVSTDPSEVSNAQVESTLSFWQCDLPILRDLDACGRDVFSIPLTPTMIVFDTGGIVQIFEVGANNNLVDELPTILDRLAKGDDLSREILVDQDAQKVAYQETLKAAMQEAGAPITGKAPAPSVPTRGQADARLEAK